ncbi:MAG: tyrosine-type recombinase/integrase [Verrucomicrobiaceae bacterium]
MSSQVSFEKVGECLYRNPSSGTYYAVTKVRGKQIKASLKTKNLTEARRKLKDHKASITRIDQRAAKNSLAHYADVVLGDAASKTDKTSKNKKRAVELIKMKWPGGSGVAITEVKPSEIRIFVQTVAGGFGWSYKNFLLSVVRNCFITAYDDHAIVEIPGERGNRKESVWKRDPVKQAIQLTPSIEQFRAIVASIRAQQFADTREETADLVEAEGTLGLGQAELANLTRKAVDIQNNTIQILRIKTKKPFVIPIYPQAKALIARRLEKTHNDPEARLFSIRDAKVAVASACRRLNFPKFSQRDFRRMFITEALRGGVNVKVIAELQGHQDGGKLILGTYSDVISGAEKQQAAETIGSAFAMKGAA